MKMMTAMDSVSLHGASTINNNIVNLQSVVEGGWGIII